MYTLKRLKHGDVIGVRSLLAENIDVDGRVDPSKPANLEPARFSIVSASANLRVIEININDLCNIPFYIRQKLIAGARKFKDHDLYSHD